MEALMRKRKTMETKKGTIMSNKQFESVLEEKNSSLESSSPEKEDDEEDEELKQSDIEMNPFS